MTDFCEDCGTELIPNAKDATYDCPRCKVCYHWRYIDELREERAKNWRIA